MANFFEDLFTGGAASRNEQARDNAKRTNKYNEAVYEFQYGDVDSKKIGGELLRNYDYAVEGLEITKRNNENNLQFQEAGLVQRYEYGMGIRAYEQQQAERVYDLSVSRALQQQSFNELAEKAATVDQDRLLNEQLLSISFDETETLLDYGIAAAGLGLRKRQAKAGAATETQATRVSALKASGAAMARGQAGRTAAKNVQGILAETGARQAAIIDELMFNTEGTAVEFLNLNNQFAIDQAALLTSRESAKLSDVAARNRIKQQALQAAIQAEASIALKPEIAPPLPIPFALPRPEYQEVFKPKKPPAPPEQVAPQTNLFAAALSTVGSAVAAGVSAGAGVVAAGQAGTGLATQAGLAAGFGSLFR